MHSLGAELPRPAPQHLRVHPHILVDLRNTHALRACQPNPLLLEFPPVAIPPFHDRFSRPFLLLFDVSMKLGQTSDVSGQPR